MEERPEPSHRHRDGVHGPGLHGRGPGPGPLLFEEEEHLPLHRHGLPRYGDPGGVPCLHQLGLLRRAASPAARGRHGVVLDRCPPLSGSLPLRLVALVAPGGLGWRRGRGGRGVRLSDHGPPHRTHPGVRGLRADPAGVLRGLLHPPSGGSPSGNLLRLRPGWLPVEGRVASGSVRALAGHRPDRERGGPARVHALLPGAQRLGLRRRALPQGGELRRGPDGDPHQRLRHLPPRGAGSGADPEHQ